MNKKFKEIEQWDKESKKENQLENGNVPNLVVVK